MCVYYFTCITWIANDTPMAQGLETTNPLTNNNTHACITIYGL